jgi:hypothetical protein
VVGTSGNEGSARPSRSRELDGAGLDLRDEVDDLIATVIDLARDEVVQGRPCPSISDPRRLDADLSVEERARRERHRADAGMRLVQLGRVRLGVGHELGQVLGRKVLLGHDQDGCPGSEADRREILGRIVFQSG